MKAEATFFLLLALALLFISLFFFLKGYVSYLQFTYTSPLPEFKDLITDFNLCRSDIVSNSSSLKCTTHLGVLNIHCNSNVCEYDIRKVGLP